MPDHRIESKRSASQPPPTSATLLKTVDTPLLLGLLILNAILHGFVVARFGVRDNNQPFLFFALVYVALAVVVYLSVPYTLWAVFVLSIIGIIGLSVTFNKPARVETLDKAIWVLDAGVVLCAGYLLFAA